MCWLAVVSLWMKEHSEPRCLTGVYETFRLYDEDLLRQRYVRRHVYLSCPSPDGWCSWGILYTLLLVCCSLHCKYPQMCPLMLPRGTCQILCKEKRRHKIALTVDHWAILAVGCAAHRCGPDWKISTTIRWSAIKVCTCTEYQLTMKLVGFQDPLAFLQETIRLSCGLKWNFSTAFGMIAMKIASRSATMWFKKSVQYSIHNEIPAKLMVRLLSVRYVFTAKKHFWEKEK